MDNRPRGRPTGGRGRGKPEDGQQQSRGPRQQQPQAWGQQRRDDRPPQQTGPPPQQAWGPPPQSSQPATRWGRPPGQQQQQPPPRAQEDQTQQMTQQMQKMTVTSAGDAPGGSQPARGKTSEPTRGTVRQRGVPSLDDTHMFRVPQSSKQGKKGKVVNLQANYFKFNTKTDLILYQYRVDFNPDIDATFVKKAILSRFKDDFGKYIFDGTVMFTMTKLREGYEVTTKDSRDDSIMNIKIRLTTDLHPGDWHYTMFMNQIMRTCLAKMDLKLVNRDYFDAAAKIDLPQHNLEIWPGYGTSIRQHETAMLLNCDVVSKVMRHETALDVLMQCREKTRDREQVKALFEEAIIGTVVITRYNNKTYKVDDVNWAQTPNSTFEVKKVPTSYKDYYRQKYQINIRDMSQPILVSKPKSKDVRGGKNELISLIPEISCVTGITESMRNDFNLMRAIADHTRIVPQAQIQRLEQGFMRRLTSTQASKEELKLWNMSFDPTLITFPGRILDPERIKMGENQTIEVDSQGSFTRAMTRKVKMLDPVRLTQWAVIYPRKFNQGDVNRFLKTCADAGRGLGFMIPEPRLEAINDDRTGTYVNAIEKVCHDNTAVLVMTIVPNVRADRYSAIKKKCYVQRPVPNQVVVAKNVNKSDMSVCTKIAIQMCCKIGGSPWSVNVPFKTPTMVVGFDVCHDKSIKGTSVGALVATINDQYTRYFSSVTFHSGGNELCDYIGIQMTKAWAEFRKNFNGLLPTRIFFYRDGVGEGNLHFTLEHEVKRIVEVWKHTYPDAGECPLTFIVVSKRINSKIYYKANNPPPGTVVDNTITLPNMYDFFLVSQSVRQGTVNPTSYNVIYDQQNVKPDVIQQLTYKFTHMYFNWGGTVRVPAPCQYAHKLAFLVAQHIHTEPVGMATTLYFL